MLETFWWLLVVTCIVWYSTISVYITVRGMGDIRGMLDRLRALGSAEEPTD